MLYVRTSQLKKPKMKVEIKGNELIIKLPVNSPATKSASGKSLVVASTKGNVETEVEVDGKRLILGVNAYVKA